jgi:hypothetical protein
MAGIFDAIKFHSGVIAEVPIGCSTEADLAINTNAIEYHLCQDRVRKPSTMPKPAEF